jgi:histidyl-tRNA synthetase
VYKRQGVERLVALMKAAGEMHAPAQCDVYLVHQGEAAQLQAFVLAERIRDAGLDVVLHCAGSTGMGNFKAQMKRADTSGANFAIILGEDEVAKEVATVKALRGEQGETQQITIAFDEVVEYLVDAIIDAEHDEHVHYH